MMHCLSCSVPAAEKLDEELFFVHNESGSGDKSKSEEGEVKQEKMTVRRRKRPLKTDMYLRPISAVKGFPVCKRRVIKKYKRRKASKSAEPKETQETADKAGSSINTDSSSGDEEYDIDASYAEIRRQHLAELESWMKRNPPNQVHTTVMSDLWADGEILSRLTSVYYNIVCYDDCTFEAEPNELEERDEHYLRVTGKMPVKVKPSQW